MTATRTRLLFAALFAFTIASLATAEPPANPIADSKPGRKKPAQTSVSCEWPSFRGHQARGVSHSNPPIRWNLETGQNIRWKTPIPGLGHSCPIVCSKRVFITTAISGKPDPELRVGLYGDIASVDDESEHEWRVLCLDLDTGRILWNQLAHKGVPRVKRHTKATHANSTPATDGRRLVAFFGSEGLYCYDTDGKLIWKKDLGVLDAGYFRVPQAQWEFASSPVIHDGRVIVQCDIQGGGFLAAFDLEDGREIWRTPRTDVPTWSTPTVHRFKSKNTAADGRSATTTIREYVLVNGWHHIGAYDFQSGKEVWNMTGGGDIPVPTPIIWEDLVFFANAHGQWGPLFAVKTASHGDITVHLAEGETRNDSVLWTDPRSYAYMQTPIVIDGLIYNCRDNGGLTCYDARTGEEIYKQRIGGGSTGFTASAVAAIPSDAAPADKAGKNQNAKASTSADNARTPGDATARATGGDNPSGNTTETSADDATKPGDGRITARGPRLYYTSEEGDVFVIQAGRTFRELARNPLGEVCLATPAIAGDTLLFRTRGHLIAVGAAK